MRIKHRIGEFLIIVSFLFFVFTYYPLLNLYFGSPQSEVLKNGYFLTIPKINAQAPIIPGINPWDEKIYLAALDKGIAQVEGSTNPGEKGTLFLFAHSSDLPWKITRYNIAFLRLGELKKNDKITISKDGKEFNYLVKEKKEVWPGEIKYLKDIKTETGKNELILMTCTPVGTSFKRLLIFAYLDLPK